MKNIMGGNLFMGKFIFGFIVGVVAAVLVLSVIYNDVAAGMESGTMFPQAWEVVRTWWTNLWH